MTIARRDLVGLEGEFTDLDGEVCECVVTGTDRSPWHNDILIVDYIVPGTERKVTGAMILARDFRPHPLET